MGFELGRKIVDALSIKKLRFRNYYKFISAEDFTVKYPEISEKYLINNNSVNVYKFKNMTLVADPEKTSIIGNKKEILNESSNYKTKLIPNNFIKAKPDNCINIGKGCNLALYFNTNYWHFTFEALDKLIALEESGYDGIYLVFNEKSIKELLRLLDIPESRIVYTEPGMIYNVEELHVVEAIRGMQNEKILNCLCSLPDKIMKKINLDDLDMYPKRIYVKRIGSRKIKNEKAFLEKLEKYNFKTIIPEDLSVEEEIKHFRAADIIITPHGAATANVIYMHPNSYFLEYFGYKYNNPCVLTVIEPKKINYYALPEAVVFPIIKGIKENFFFIGARDDMWVNLRLLDVILNNIVRNEKLKQNNQQYNQELKKHEVFWDHALGIPF